MRTTPHSLIYFTSTIAAVIITLLILNWLPLALQKETVRRYATFEEARAKLNLREARVPSYFPESIRWPPREVLAQTRPFPAILMVFNKVGSREPHLIISQTASEAFPGNGYLSLHTIKERVQYQLKGKKALLKVGTCGDQEPCSSIAWTEGAFRIFLTMKEPPFELIRIAESMASP